MNSVGSKSSCQPFNDQAYNILVSSDTLRGDGPHEVSRRRFINLMDPAATQRAVMNLLVDSLSLFQQRKRTRIGGPLLPFRYRRLFPRGVFRNVYCLHGRRVQFIASLATQSFAHCIRSKIEVHFYSARNLYQTESANVVGSPLFAFPKRAGTSVPREVPMSTIGYSVLFRQRIHIAINHQPIFPLGTRGEATLSSR